MDTLVDVNIVDEDNNETSMLAKIVEEGQDTYKVRFMVHVKGDLYNYEDEITEIEKDSVSGFYDSTDERDAGFIKTMEGYQPMDDDDNWEPSESDDESESESESDDDDCSESEQEDFLE